MIKKIKGGMRSPRYKAQKLFVITDVVVNFKYRFCVIGLVAEAWRDFERTAEKGGINVEFIGVFNSHIRRIILCRSFGGQVVRNKRMGEKK